MQPHATPTKACSLLGNSFHAGVLAWLLSHQLVEWGILARPISVAEAADPGIPANLFDTTPVPLDIDETEAALTLVRHYLSKQGHRGGDIYNINNVVTVNNAIPQAINPQEWEWVTAISTQCVQCNERH